MAITVASLAGTPYEITTPAVQPAHALPPVFAYNWNNARVTVATGAGTTGRTRLTLTSNAAGDTIFLPFQQNQVHSVYIDTALAAAGG